MANDSCEICPFVKGKPSVSYLKLVELTGIQHREVANLLYAYTKIPYYLDKMKDAGYELNFLDEFDAKDIWEFFDGAKLLPLDALIELKKRELKARDSEGNTIAIGQKDANDNYVGHESIEDAYREVTEFNNKEENKGYVAYIVQNGDRFNVVVRAKDATTQYKLAKTNKEFELWNVVKATFKSFGLSIDNLSEGSLKLFNPLDIADRLRWISSLQRTSNRLMDRRSILTLLELSKKEDGSYPLRVERLMAAYGTLEEVADMIYQVINRGDTSLVSDTTKQLMDATLTEIKSFNGHIIKDFVDSIDSEMDSFKDSSIAAEVEEQVKDFRKLIKNAKKEVVDTMHSLNTVQRTLERMIKNLSKTVEDLHRQYGKNSQEKNTFKELLDKLETSIESKKIAVGITAYLNVITNEMDRLFTEAQETFDCLQKDELITPLGARDAALTILDLELLQDKYAEILESLVNLKNKSDESDMTMEEIEKVEALAKAVQDLLNKCLNLMEDNREKFLIKCVQQFAGDSLGASLSATQILLILQKDINMLSRMLYSMTKTTNPILNVFTGIIREAQEKRDYELNKIVNRIRRADAKLRKAGIKNSFIFDEDGNIISEYDWETYNKERKKYYGSLKKLGLDDSTIDSLMETWENSHLTPLIVDSKTGRVEMVPIYKKALHLSPAEKEYYDEMLAIKGELESYYPDYARNLFAPVQIRKDWIERLITAKGFAQKCKVIKELLLFWKVWQDDTRYGDSIHAKTDYKNFKKLGVPVYYVAKIPYEQRTLDFSRSLEALAGAALNYKHMNRVASTMEVLKNYLNDKHTSITGKDNLLNTRYTRARKIISILRKRFHDTNILPFVLGVIESLVYGIKHKEKGLMSRLLGGLILFTSVNSLAVNVFGAGANFVQTRVQSIIEGAAGEFFNYSHWLKAEAILGGNLFTGLSRDFVDFLFRGEVQNNKLRLCAELFNVVQTQFENSKDRTYSRSFAHKVLKQDWGYALYSVGDYISRLLTMVAVLLKTKVQVIDKDGNYKKVSLWSAIKTLKDKQAGTSELDFENVYDLLGNPIDSNYINTVKKRVRLANQLMHGAMNDEDKGLLHRYILGRLVMNFRQWMVGVYSKRYRGKYWDADLKQWREGSYATAYYVLRNYFRVLTNQKSKIEKELLFKNLSKERKANLRRMLADYIVYLTVKLLVIPALGDPDESEGDWWVRYAIYQALRVDLEMGGTVAGIEIVNNAQKIINSPIAAATTMEKWLLLFDVSSMFETTGTSILNQENKWVHNVENKVVPFAKHVKLIGKFDTDDTMFNIFDD